MPSKYCRGCGKEFHKRTRSESNGQWEARRYCGYACARKPGVVRHVPRVVDTTGRDTYQFLADDRDVPCRLLAVDLYPMEGERYQSAAERLAPLVWRSCAVCPLRQECRTEGAKGEQGVWGGVLFIPGYDPIDLLAAGPVVREPVEVS